MPERHISFPSLRARAHYTVLMALFARVRRRERYGQIARALGRVFGPRSAVHLTEQGGAPFGITLNDGYWTRFALFREDYEPEVAALLQAAAGQTPLFCDLGANKGYWTCRAAPLFARIIAVEASAQTFTALTDNAGGLANVTLRHNAVHATSGQTLRFLNVAQSHASARLAGAGDTGSIEEVDTLCIDDLVPDGMAALIKLDVEGAEIPAITGAHRALGDGCVLIYEDHGNDPACAPSAHLLAQPGMQIFAMDGGLTRLETLDALRARKPDPYTGYNFIAAHETSTLLRRLARRLQSARP